jgi:hypothetical protein
MDIEKFLLVIFLVAQRLWFLPASIPWKAPLRGEMTHLA